MSRAAFGLPAEMKRYPEKSKGISWIARAIRRLTLEDPANSGDQETWPQVVEPFFATKFRVRRVEMAKMCGFVTKVGGRIAVESTAGRGTIVRIRFPDFGRTGENAMY